VGHDLQLAAALIETDDRIAGNLIATVNLEALPAIDRSPDRYEAASVCVTGEVLDLRVEDSRLVRPYTVFSLQETAPDGSYDFINIISLPCRLSTREPG